MCLPVPAAVSASYYFQDLKGPAILNVTPSAPLTGIIFTGLPANATQVLAQTGNLHFGRLRMVLSPGRSSVRFALAVSYSTQTEVIAKPAWRALLDVSYDFDAVLSQSASGVEPRAGSDRAGCRCGARHLGQRGFATRPSSPRADLCPAQPGVCVGIEGIEGSELRRDVHPAV